jgi:hypothetical protein
MCAPPRRKRTREATLISPDIAVPSARSGRAKCAVRSRRAAIRRLRRWATVWRARVRREQDLDMARFLLIMHDDTTVGEDTAAWGS